eukprot:CAMPEP_0179888498 /NCGR_PEP_ID=MMETSP0982-20121206/31999_1 /TAXON_ID=483367 /ORGANISM="non described non described, Strain CCMP 2436" /LENGTH=103 /DNA_ID=CAMNT_0021784455 /DNA_START=107 /DNA_END=415 /DNA_ORIENTATION=+
MAQPARHHQCSTALRCGVVNIEASCEQGAQAAHVPFHAHRAECHRGLVRRRRSAGSQAKSKSLSTRVLCNREKQVKDGEQVDAEREGKSGRLKRHEERWDELW